MVTIIADLWVSGDGIIVVCYVELEAAETKKGTIFFSITIPLGHAIGYLQRR